MAGGRVLLELVEVLKDDRLCMEVNGGKSSWPGNSISIQFEDWGKR